MVLSPPVEPLWLLHRKVCSPDMDVNFKPAGCLLEFMGDHFAVGFASAHLPPNSDIARVLMLHDRGYYQADWPLIHLRKKVIL